MGRETQSTFATCHGRSWSYLSVWSTSTVTSGKKRSELLAPLTALTSKNVKYDWKDEQQKCFDAIKRVIGREVLLAYPDFSALFEIHTDASKLLIGAVISQKGKPIAFDSRKMNGAQQNYTTTEK